MMTLSVKVAHLELVKDASRGIEGSLNTDMANMPSKFSDDNGLLLTLHGVCQQENREETKNIH
jgi:hypothetical protein